MSWEQINNGITFRVFYTASKVGKTGLADVTVDVYRNDVAIVTGAAATEIAGGAYKYALAQGSVTVEGEYLAIFHTADATVDQKDIPSLWIVGRAGVEDLDAAISSRLATSGYTAPPAASANADAVWDELLADHVIAGSAGKALGDIVTADPVVIAPAVGAGGELSLVRGDDYKSAEGREVSFSSADWPDLTGVGSTGIVLTVRRRAEAFGSGSDPVLFSVNDKVASRVVGTGTQTVVFEFSAANTAALLPGTQTGKYDVQATLANNDVFTLVTGLASVTEDQTR